MALVIGNVKDVYERNAELKKGDVERLLEWMEMQPHLPKMTEMQMIHFLHSNNFSSEAAKQCIDLYLTVRTHCPDFFANRDPNVINLNVMLYTPLPKPTKEGYRVVYSKIMDPNADNYNIPIQIKMFDMATMLMLNQEGPAPGQVVIHDLAGLTFAHITKINILLTKKFFFYLQECMPVRIKGLHFINTGTLMDKVLSLIKPFMKKDLIDVLHTHPDISSIYKFVPQECFPADFEGGTAPTVQQLHDQQKRTLVEHAAFFKEEETQIVDETKRPGKPKDASEVFGVEGTFKKLDID